MSLQDRTEWEPTGAWYERRAGNWQAQVRVDYHLQTATIQIYEIDISPDGETAAYEDSDLWTGELRANEEESLEHLQQRALRATDALLNALVPGSAIRAI